VSEETNRNLPSRNTLVQFLALYTDRGRLRKHSHIEATLSRSSKVIDFGTNRKRVPVCDFLLVRHSNLGPILQVAPFRRYDSFYALDPTPIPP